MMDEMNMSIDRIDGGIVTLVGSDNETIRMTLPATHLPPGAKEGDVLTLRLEKDEPATAAAKKRVSGLIDRLRKKG